MLHACAMGAGMTIRMLTPACAESKRLIDWVESGARLLPDNELRCMLTTASVQRRCSLRSHSFTPSAELHSWSCLMATGVHDALEKRYIKVRRHC